MSKQEATRLADALESGNPSLTMEEAAALLRRWPDSGAPVGYLPAYELDRLQSGHDGRLRSAKLGPSYLDGDVAVYTAPPADAERIAALEAENAALKVEMSWPIPCHIATTTYRFDGERQVHIPQLLLEFAAVPVGAPNTAQGWADRDSVARLIADATTPADATARIAALEAALAERDRVIEQARGALEPAKHGLAWYRDRHPEDADGGDDEADARIAAALRAIEEVQR